MLIDRQRLEEKEEEYLAPYGIRSKNTKGREYPDEKPTYRTAFQRDRDNIKPRSF